MHPMQINQEGMDENRSWESTMRKYDRWLIIGQYGPDLVEISISRGEKVDGAAHEEAEKHF